MFSLLLMLLSVHHVHGWNMWESDWTTVFVACSGNGQSVWDAWKDNAGVTCEASSVVEDADTCKQSHQSDPILNEWRSSRIEQVRLRLWKDGEIVVEMKFNGTDTNKFNWFAQSKLLSSSYSDIGELDAHFTFFSSYGYGYGVNRRFYINKSNYLGCAVDAGWMFVKDVGYGVDCLFDSYKKYPYFLYATNYHSGVWQTEGDYDFADMMSIQVHQGEEEQKGTTTTEEPEEM
ncbi:uncharacterized protein LOC127710949 [Mytilus californianus]|uniref:uncharacterized protein LOC127710949 n=1 Tax=Mytilus californianus TaxID=6549 RepID=UPI002245448C|nr:uncharacterized protein LOC127710949 [Mytilus californianus]